QYAHHRAPSATTHPERGAKPNERQRVDGTEDETGGGAPPTQTIGWTALHADRGCKGRTGHRSDSHPARRPGATIGRSGVTTVCGVRATPPGAGDGVRAPFRWHAAWTCGPHKGGSHEHCSPYRHRSRPAGLRRPELLRRLT